MAWIGLSALAQYRGARPDDTDIVGDDYRPAPRTRIWYRNATFARVNPLGPVDVLKLGVRQRLSTKDSLLLRDTYAFGGLDAVLTPGG